MHSLGEWMERREMEISEELSNAKKTLGNAYMELDDIIDRYYKVGEISEWEYMQIQKAKEEMDKAWIILGEVHKEMHEFERKYL